MKVNNNNEARTEKKTRDLGTFVILNQKSIINYVDEILNKFESDPSYKEKILNQMLPERKYKNTKKSQDYKLISRILKEEMGIQGVGETTIWRLLRIKDEYPEVYEQIKENKTTITAAYNKLFEKERESKAKIKESNPDLPDLLKKRKLDFDKLQKELQYIEEEIDKISDDEKKQPSLKKLKQVDTQLFRLRKKIGNLITENDPDKFV
ncbi:MAG: hypothetical protein IJI66_16780 [Erysipelotrichaceae bacterium]|nr:hypothetical protein [Erysipelotrichaceae bacterium]